MALNGFKIGHFGRLPGSGGLIFDGALPECIGELMLKRC